MCRGPVHLLQNACVLVSFRFVVIKQESPKALLPVPPFPATIVKSSCEKKGYHDVDAFLLSAFHELSEEMPVYLSSSL